MMSLYGAVHAGIIVGFSAWAYRRLRSEGIDSPTVLTGIAVTLWGALLGAAALGWLVVVSRGEGASFLAAVREGGGTVVGALAGAGVVAYFFCRKIDRDWDWTFDLLCVPVPLAQAIGRLACWHAGCCFGSETDGPFGILLRNSEGVLARRYPTQLISAVADAAIFVALVVVARWSRKTRPPRPYQGFLFFLFVALYAVKRFLVDFLRATDPPFCLGLTWSQLVAGAAIAVIAVVMISRRSRRV